MTGGRNEERNEDRWVRGRGGLVKSQHFVKRRRPSVTGLLGRTVATKPALGRVNGDRSAHMPSRDGSDGSRC